MTQESVLNQLFWLFGSWAAVTGGVWTLFQHIEKVASAEFKEETSKRLETARLGHSLSWLAGHLRQGFDLVFGKRLLSFRAFFRSALLSFVFTGTLFALWVALRPDECPLCRPPDYADLG